MSSLFTGCSNPLPRCFFLTGPWEEENGRARGAESLSEVKAIREHREARLKLSQWEQSVPLCAASVWNFPKHDTHSAWVSSACRGRPARLSMTARHLQLILVKFQKFALRINVGWLQGMTESASWSLREVLIRLLEAFQRRIPESAKSQQRRVFVAEEKKSEMRLLWPFYFARRPSHFGGQWRAA